MEFLNDNMMRNENILILPYNTIRMVDIAVQMDLNKATYGEPLKFPFKELLQKLITRKYKDLSKYNPKINPNIIKKLVKTNFKKYYDLAPRTELQDIIFITENQKFTSSVKVLFDTPDVTDNFFDYDYYDGSIYELEKYILNNSITTIILDDAELLYTLSERGNIDFNYKTIMISKLGYNMTESTSGLQMKYYNKIKEKFPDVEIAMIDLFTF